MSVPRWSVRFELGAHHQYQREVMLETLHHLDPTVDYSDPPTLEVSVLAHTGTDAAEYVEGLLRRGGTAMPWPTALLDLRLEGAGSTRR